VKFKYSTSLIFDEGFLLAGFKINKYSKKVKEKK
jgi:hypothetical protein